MAGYRTFLVIATALLFAHATRAASNEVESVAAIDRIVSSASNQPAPSVSSSVGSGYMASEMASLVALLKQRESDLAVARAETEHLRDVVRRIADASRKERLTMLYNQGCVYRAVKDFKRAEESFLAALGINPNDAGVHYNLAILYDDNLNQKKKARSHYERFLALAPDDPDAAKVREWLAALDSPRLKEPELGK